MSAAGLPAGPDRGRRRLLGLGAALPLLASCAGRVVVRRGEPVALAPEEGLAAVVVRRVAVGGCSDRFGPGFDYVRRGDAQRRRLLIGRPDNDWAPDPGRPLLIRTTYLLRLPAGVYSFVRASWYDHPVSHVVQLPPWRFEIVAGRAVYVGGLGIQTGFSRGILGCDGRGGSFFFHADAGSDIPFVRSCHPDLANTEVADASSVRPRWPGPPAG